MSISSLDSLNERDNQKKRTVDSSGESSDAEMSEAQSSSDPEYSNNLWEVEKIRGHWPAKAKKDDRCFYYVTWKLKKGQKEDWPDEENWILSTGMKCPDMLRTYWNEVEKDLRKGRRPLKLYPPDNLAEFDFDKEPAKPLPVKKSRKYHKKIAKNSNVESKYESSDDDREDELNVRPPRSKSRSSVDPTQRKKPTWQEKINLPKDEYFIDKDDNMPVILSDEERPKAIREEAKRDTEEKERIKERKHRKESETHKEDKEKRNEALKKIEAERERRKRRITHQKGEQKRQIIDNHYETVAPPNMISKLRKELENRQNQAGHWRAKESLLEATPTNSKKSITRQDSESPNICEPSNANPPTIPDSLDASSADLCNIETHIMRDKRHESDSDNESLSDQEDILPPKRKKVVQISSSSEEEVTIQKRIKQERPDEMDSFLENFPSREHNSDVDEIEPLIKDLQTDDLVIADPDEGEPFSGHNENSESPSRISHCPENTIFTNWMKQFIAECWTKKYPIERKLKPVYVFMFAIYKEVDYAITVFENKAGVEPMYICECVPAIEVWYTNKQVIIDAEKRLRESNRLPHELNLPKKYPTRGMTPPNR